MTGYRCAYCRTVFQTEVERNEHEKAAARNHGCFRPDRRRWRPSEEQPW